MLRSRVILKRCKVQHKNLSKEIPKDKGRILGYAYIEDYKIEIDPNQSDKEYLNTLIHEHLHIFLPDLKERHIIKMADLLAQAIWSKKYRKHK